MQGQPGGRGGRLMLLAGRQQRTPPLFHPMRRGDRVVRCPWTRSEGARQFGGRLLGQALFVDPSSAFRGRSLGAPFSSVAGGDAQMARWVAVALGRAQSDAAVRVCIPKLARAEDHRSRWLIASLSSSVSDLRALRDERVNRMRGSLIARYLF